MRLRMLLCALLLALFPLYTASADTVTYGDTTYVFPSGAASPAHLSLSVSGTSFDPQTLAPMAETGIPGAVFGVYAKDAQGAFVPFANPENPLKPLQIVSAKDTVDVALPLSIDLYLRLESLPDGYIAGDDQPDYMPLRLPQAVEYHVRRADMQGVWLTLTAQTAEGAAPLADIPFTLEGAGETHRLMTDAEGRASAAGIAPGEYVLRQAHTIEGFGIDEPAVALTVKLHEPLHIALQNSKDGLLSLRTLGLAMDGSRVPRLIPVDRSYDVYDAAGNPCGTVSANAPLALAATAEGASYTLRVTDAGTDGFSADTDTHTVVIYPGQTTAYETVARSEKGFFAFQHLSAESGMPVSGGTFALLDAQNNPVLTFSPDENGGFEPSTPLSAGSYTLRMTHAADGHLFSQRPYPVVITPFFEAQSIAEIAFSSTPIPAELLAPQVTANTASLPSLFDADARIDFTLQAFAGPPKLPVNNLTYTYTLPTLPGLTVETARADGASLSIARRLPLAGVEEIQSLAVSGAVSYDFTYQVDSAGNMKTITINEPFTVPIAAFSAAAPVTYAVSGHVYDEHNQPMTGFLVSLGDAEMETDPFGAYAFASAPSGSSVVFHAAEGYGAKTDGADAYILPLRTVTGQVTTHGPVGGYPVTLRIGDLPTATPDGQGRFSITGIMASSDRLRAEVPEDVLVRVAQEGDRATVDLYAAASIAGSVTDPDGQPVPGARIAISGAGDNRTAQTDAQGAYDFAGLFPGDYTLTFQAPAGHVINGDSTQTLTVEAGDAVSGIDADMMVPAGISGTLLDGEVPYASIAVTLQPSGLETITDETGRFEFGGLQTGSYSLAFDVTDETVLTDLPEAIAVTRPAERIDVTVHAVRPARMLGRVWLDGNDDGLLSLDETGIEGAVVMLLDSQEAEVAAQTTAADGEFAFTGLTPDKYRLRVTLPDGMIFAREAPGMERIAFGVDGPEATSGWYTLASGQKLDGLICGGISAGSISGAFWEDLDGNGMLDAKEPPLAGASIALLRDGQPVGQLASDEKGQYRFENLRPGDYILRIALPTGSIFTIQPLQPDGISSDLPTSNGGTADHALSLRRWRMDPVVNVGTQRAASLSGHVWFDEHAGGKDPGEAGHAGLTVALYDTGAIAPALIREALTDVQGNVHFDGLRPGTYQLRYHLPSADSWGFTAGTEQVSGAWGYGAAVQLENGAAHTAAGVGITKLGSISGVAFEDTDYSGLRAEGKPGVQMQASLLDAAGAVIETKQTQADGSYLFGRLPTGMYTVRFTAPDGYAFTKARPDAPSFNSDVPETADSTSQTSPIYLPLGESVLVDVGVYQPASVAGAFWQDLQNNGLYSAENPPLAGYTVALLKNGEPHAEVTTDAQGHYRFSGLAPDTYALRVTLPGNMRFSTKPSDATAPGSAILSTDRQTGETAAFALRNGEHRAAVDIGAVFTGTVSGRAVSLKDQTGLAGVQVALTRSGITLMETVTGPDGAYRLADVRPGPAEIRFTAPDGWAIAEDQANPAATTVLQGGEAGQVNINCLPESTLSGTIWLDGDADGILSGTEAPLLGVSVSLHKQTASGDIFIGTGKTNSAGQYRFDKLLPGSYTLQFTPPDGMLLYDGNQSAPFALAMGEEKAMATSAYIGSTISGNVWEDADNDGLRALDDVALSGVSVSLVRPTGSVVAQTETNMLGTYQFDGIPPIECAVRFTLPDDYVFTEPQVGGSVVPVTDGYVGTTKVFALSMGETIRGVDAGAVRHTRIGDLVWLDENANGLQDTDEPGVPNVPVQLLRVYQDSSEELVAETMTDANGRYRFNAVRPGTYRIAIGVGEAYLPTRIIPELAQINSKLLWDEGPILRSDVFTALSGIPQLTIDAGLVTPAIGKLIGWVIDEPDEPEATATPMASATAAAQATASASPSPRPTAAGLFIITGSDQATATPSPAPTAEEEVYEEGETIFQPSNRN